MKNGIHFDSYGYIEINPSHFKEDPLAKKSEYGKDEIDNLSKVTYVWDMKAELIEIIGKDLWDSENYAYFDFKKEDFDKDFYENAHLDNGNYTEPFLKFLSHQPEFSRENISNALNNVKFMPHNYDWSYRITADIDIDIIPLYEKYTKTIEYLITKMKMGDNLLYDITKLSDKDLQTFAVAVQEEKMKTKKNIDGFHFNSDVLHYNYVKEIYDDIQDEFEKREERNYERD